jgi:uridine kinase
LGEQCRWMLAQCVAQDVLRDLLVVVGLGGPSPGGLTTRLAEVGTHARAWIILLGHDSFVKTTKKTRCRSTIGGPEAMTSEYDVRLKSIHSHYPR